MNINQKIWLGFGILIGMVLVGSSIGYVKSQKADHETHQLAEVNLAERDAAQNAQNALKNAAIQEQIFIYTKDSNAIPRFETAVADVKAQLSQAAKVSPDVTRRNNAAQTLATADAYLASFQKLVALKIRRGLTQNDGLEGELRLAVHQVEAKAQAQGLAELSVTMLMARRHEKDYLLRGDPAYVSQIQDCITNFCKQMKELSLNDDLQKEMLGLWTKYLTAMQALVAGEQQIKVVQGEFETQSQAINNQLAAIVSAASADLKICNTGVLNDLSLGKQANFYGIVVGSLVGLLIACWVAASLRSLTRTIFNSASVISGGANQIVSASGQVSTSSQSLAEGSSEQAASVEETGASLEELSSMTKRNAENAQKAKDLAREARSAADMGAGDMQAMNTAMQAIKTSSDDIAKIIKTIDEIAFQTNILALNAAVEAARAGEAGMGFAVVADEVRSLAQRSATAAKETAAKIEGAINNTTQGVQLSTKVTGVLQGIMAKVRQVDELVAEVAGASSEQTQGITQINSAVAQMDKVTQSNAANAEESAAAAEELNSQAAVLNQAVEDLLQLVGGAASRPQPRAAAAPRPMIQSAPQRPALQHGHRQGQPSVKPAALTAARRTDIPMAGDFQNF